MVDGTESTNLPFGRSTPVRVQVSYDALAFPGPGPYELTSISLRMQSGEALAGKLVDLEVRMSTVDFGVESLQSRFAANRGADETVVFPRQIFTFPAVAGSSPGGFAGPIPLAVPFRFTPVLGRSLVVEFIVHGQPPGVFVLDLSGLCTSPQSRFGVPSCGPTVGTTPDIEIVTTQIVWGRDVVFRIVRAIPNQPVLLLFGVFEGGSIGGLPLPVALDPLGAPGCALNLLPVLSFPFLADTTGTATFPPLPVPSIPSFKGAPIFVQGLVVAPGLNPLGILMTEGLRSEVCGFEPVSRVFGAGLTADSGLREVGAGPVIRFGLR